MSDASNHPCAPAQGHKTGPTPVARRGSGGTSSASGLSFTHKSKLPRLAREFYQGHAAVLWTHTFEQRTTGWLNDAFHDDFREVLLHACGRYAVASPCYVPMPDHWHLVWLGLRPGSDQCLATAFLRKNARAVLGAARLQDRAHDRVLREEERMPEAFQSACSYVCNNPQRAGLCNEWRKWPYLGAMILGYPRLDPREVDFWTDFWKIHNRLMEDPCASAQGYSSQGRSSSPPRERRDTHP